MQRINVPYQKDWAWNQQKSELCASRHNVYHQEYHQVPLLLICVKYFKIGLGEKLRFWFINKYNVSFWNKYS